MKFDKQLFFIIVSLAIVMLLIKFLLPVLADDTEDKGRDRISELLARVTEWNVQKAINETLPIADRFVCFNDLNDYFKFRLDHDKDNNTDYTVVFPCPDLDISKLPKDESNK